VCVVFSRFPALVRPARARRVWAISIDISSSLVSSGSSSPSDSTKSASFVSSSLSSHSRLLLFSPLKREVLAPFRCAPCLLFFRPIVAERSLELRACREEAGWPPSLSNVESRESAQCARSYTSRGRGWDV